MNNNIISFNATYQGYNHKKINKVCEDSSGSISTNRDGSFYIKQICIGKYKISCNRIINSVNDIRICCVADGHGSSNYPRTHIGSKLAVESAIECILSFIETIGLKKEDNNITFDELLNDGKKEYFRQLSKSILNLWNDKVKKHYLLHKFTEIELKEVSKKYKDMYLSIDENNSEDKQRIISKAYGTTLIAFAFIDNYSFGLQIGDGKCVIIDENFNCKVAIPLDKNCNLNVTTSICDSDAIDEFHYYGFSKRIPMAVFCGTDGIDDSYVDDNELFDLYKSILKIANERGKYNLSKEIMDFLPYLTKKGSGDDVSISGIINFDLLEKNIYKIDSSLTEGNMNE